LGLAFLRRETMATADSGSRARPLNEHNSCITCFFEKLGDIFRYTVKGNGEGKRPSEYFLFRQGIVKSVWRNP